MKITPSILLLMLFTGGNGYASPLKGVGEVINQPDSSSSQSPYGSGIHTRLRSGIDAVLDGHHLVASKTDWLRLMKMPGTIHYLQGVAADGYAPLLRRQRALAGLAQMPTVSVISTIRSLLHNGRTATGVRASAAESLATLQGVRALSELAPLLSHPKLRLREAVIRAFRHIRHERAVIELRTQLAKEKDPVLRKTLGQVIAGQTADATQSLGELK
jgi:hypothetical protein